MSPLAISVEILDSTMRNRWKELYDLLPENIRDINFSFEYHFLYEINGDGKIRLFLYREGSLIYFYPFLIREINSNSGKTVLRDIETVYGYTGPISNSNEREFILRANVAFKEYCQSQNVVCEFIRFHPLLANHKIASLNLDLNVIALRDYVYVDLLDGEDEIWNKYSAQNRNKIRKAEKLGVEIQSGFSKQSFGTFVDLYLENMRLVKAAPMYFFSNNFFDGLSELAQSNGMFFIAKKEGQMVGAAVFLIGAEISHYFLAAASPEGKKLAAGNLLLHEGILWCKKNGSQKLHLGGGVSQEQDDPLLVFKRNFSSLSEKFYIGKRIHDQEIYSALVSDWDHRFPSDALKYKNILQRYRMTKADLV